MARPNSRPSPLDNYVCIIFSRKIGYFAWSWYGNNEKCKALDIATSWAGEELSPWGEMLVQGPYGIIECHNRRE